MLECMGKVTISFEMTLDGVFDQMEHWFDPDDPGVQRASDDLVFGADAVLLGRESYEFFREYWPKQTDDRGFADHYNALPKYVASTTLSGPLDWNATLIEGDVAETVRALKEQYTSIVSHGYGDLAATLVDAGSWTRCMPASTPSWWAIPSSVCAHRIRWASACSRSRATSRASSPRGTRRRSARRLQPAEPTPTHQPHSPGGFDAGDVGSTRWVGSLSQGREPGRRDGMKRRAGGIS